MTAPDRGDVVWLDFDPQTGREQAGTRPAIVLTPREYNKRSGLAVFVPVTSQVKGYPFEVPLPPGFKVAGVALADQVKSFDWGRRRARFAARLPDDILDEIVARVATLIGANA